LGEREPGARARSRAGPAHHRLRGPRRRAHARPLRPLLRRQDLGDPPRAGGPHHLASSTIGPGPRGLWRRRCLGTPGSPACAQHSPRLLEESAVPSSGEARRASLRFRPDSRPGDLRSPGVGAAMTEESPFGACPMPFVDTEEVLLGHGSGGKLTARLIEQMIVPAFKNPILKALDDQAVLPVEPIEGARLAFTTDSYVVTPIFFPGGDIGELAVNGTVNDLAMGGAQPRWLSLAFILEEGFPLREFARVVESTRRAAARAGALIVTGDTKVVGRGSGDKVFINTSGIGVVPSGISLSSRRVQPGDA